MKHIASGILIILALAKLPLLQQHALGSDPTTGLPNSLLVNSSIPIELAIALLLFQVPSIGAISLVALSSVFIVYHISALLTWQSVAPCPCLGAIADVAGLSPFWSHMASLGVSITLFTLGLQLLPSCQSNVAPIKKSSQLSYSFLYSLVVLLLIVALTPLVIRFDGSTPLLLGGDEDFELMKGRLIAGGHRLYHEIWSDQPPLYSWLIAIAHIPLENASTLVRFSTLIVFAIGMATAAIWVRTESGLLAAILFLLFYCSSATVQLLAVSAMQEAPMISISLIASYCLTRSLNIQSDRLYFLGASLFGIALLIKFTAVLFLVACFASNIKQIIAQKRFSQSILTLLYMLSSVAAVLFLTAGSRIETLIQPHLSPKPSNVLEFTASTFQFQYILQQKEVYILAACSVAIRLYQGSVGKISFPIALLTCQFIFSAFYRPWFSYYYAGLALPICWLAGDAMGQIISEFVNVARGHFNSYRTAVAISLLVFTLGISALWYLPQRLTAFWVESYYKPSAAESPWVSLLRTEARLNGPLVYARNQILAYHAGMRSAPELAVLSTKRFSSGSITKTGIIEIIQTKQIKTVLLRDEPISSEFRRMLATDFNEIRRMNGEILFRRR